MVDTASTESYITQWVAEKLALPKKSKQVVTVKLNESKAEEVSTSKFYLKLPYKTEVECTIVERIVPAVSSKIYKQVQKFIEKNCDVKFNEIDEDYLDVDILLGIEHLPKIYLENFKTFNNLAIHKTKLGYYALGTKDTTESNTTTAWSLVTLKKDMTVEDIIFAEDNELQQK